MRRNIIPLFIPHKGCQHACVFCNQRHITGEDTKTLEQIDQEFRSQLPFAASKPELAYYGGTFTGMPIGEIIGLLDLALGYYEADLISGIRFSTHPGTLDRAKIEILKQYPITLVELGVQSFSNGVLQASKRGTTDQEILEAVESLVVAKIPFGIQLMMGLPEDTFEQFIDSVEKSIALNSEVIRLYPTVVIQDTELAERYNAGHYVPLSLDEAIRWSVEALRLYQRAGIPVIRLGLHATEDLTTGTAIVAGPFHPAFRQLVDSEVIYQALVQFHRHNQTVVPTIIRVHSTLVSDVSGQKGQNRLRIRALFDAPFRIQASQEVPLEWIEIESDGRLDRINKWN